jgi:hypothetical protein
VAQDRGESARAVCWAPMTGFRAILGAFVLAGVAAAQQSVSFPTSDDYAAEAAEAEPAEIDRLGP